jgi:hypothetical protein
MCNITFQCNKGCTNVRQCYVICTLLTLYYYYYYYYYYYSLLHCCRQIRSTTCPTSQISVVLMHLNAHQSVNDARAARGVIYLWFALKEVSVTHKV